MGTEYDPAYGLELRPPAKLYADNILVDDVGPGGLGKDVPFWKVLLMRTASARAMVRADSAAAEMIRADSVAAETVQAPPPPASEPELEPEPPPLDPDEADLAEMLSLVSEACASISGRLHALKSDRERTDAILEKMSATIQ
jgi:hypothetical protein